MSESLPVISTNEPRSETTQHRVILDAEEVRDVGSSEAAGLVRECLAITYKRFDVASWHALDDLSNVIADVPGAPTSGKPADDRAVKIAAAVRAERSKFFPRFRSEFDLLFQARREGKVRDGLQRGASAATLALVGERDHTGQVSLKSAVQAMSAATREDGFGFDLRARIVMREPPASTEFKNPWGAELVCDALGNTCRALWLKDAAWRPIMEHLVIMFTPVVVALHRELDALLQDRDILPVLRVHTRRRVSGAGAGGPTTALQPDEGSLYDKLLAIFMDESPAAAAQPLPAITTPGTDPLDFGDADAWNVQAGPVIRGAPTRAAEWSTVLRALDRLERGKASAAERQLIPDVDAEELRAGTANVLPTVAAAAENVGGSGLDRVTIEILSRVLDEIFDNPYLLAEIKTVFGRLQIPMLKAALRDRSLLSQPAHPVRRFFDTLAKASVGLRSGDARDGLFIALANHLATVIRDREADDRGVFATARDELETFLDAERAAYNRQLAQALPALIALDEHEAAHEFAKVSLAVRFAGRDIPPEIRGFLDHEGLDRLTDAYLRDGPDGAAWNHQLQDMDDLVWSIAPGPGPDARRRLVQLVPQLLRRVGEGWPVDEESRARRKVFLARLYDLHIEAMNALPDLPHVDEPPDIPVAAREVVPERMESERRAVAAADAFVGALMRGDWCSFVGEEGEASLLARFAWRAPHGTKLLFTHRDGAIAVIHSPTSLDRAHQLGRVQVAAEAIPLFEQAMERMLEQRAVSV